MGKKLNCCKKKSSSSFGCCDSSSTSSTSCSTSSTSCSTSSTYCCPKYPKCCCIVNKCAPIYYPNKCVGQYPCPSPCPPPCPPYPCPPYPCPSQCNPSYNTYDSIVAGSSISFNLPSQYSLFIVNPSDTSGNLYLPSIGSLSSCCYKKTFIISNIGSNDIILNPSTTTTTTDNINGLQSFTIAANTSVNVYSAYISGTGYWCLT